MQKIEPVRRTDVPKTPQSLGAILVTALAAACGGAADVLHDVVEAGEGGASTRPPRP